MKTDQFVQVLFLASQQSIVEQQSNCFTKNTEIAGGGRGRGARFRFVLNFNVFLNLGLEGVVRDGPGTHK